MLVTWSGSGKTLLLISMNQSFWRFYVYELVDPRDGLTFYVGKGQRDRIAAHEKQALKGVCSPKCNKIRDIWDEGFEVKRTIVAHFQCENTAYAFEESRIAEYGLESLTNLAAGGGVPRSYRKRLRKTPTVTVPVTALGYVNWLKSTKNGFEWLATYLRFKKSDQSAKLVSANKFHLSLHKLAFESLFPKMWDCITTSRVATNICRDRLLSYGVEIVYGRP